MDLTIPLSWSDLESFNDFLVKDENERVWEILSCDEFDNYIHMIDIEAEKEDVEIYREITFCDLMNYSFLDNSKCYKYYDKFIEE